MRTFCRALAITILCATSHSALAESKWLESGRLKVSEIKVLCDRVSDVRLLGRMQMITSGDDRWRRLSRQELVIEAAAMGVAPLDPSRCYVIARARPSRGRGVPHLRGSRLYLQHRTDFGFRYWASLRRAVTRDA